MKKLFELLWVLGVFVGLAAIAWLASKGAYSQESLYTLTTLNNDIAAFDTLSEKGSVCQEIKLAFQYPEVSIEPPWPNKPSDLFVWESAGPTNLYKEIGLDPYTIKVFGFTKTQILTDVTSDPGLGYFNAKLRLGDNFEYINSIILGAKRMCAAYENDMGDLVIP